MARRLNVGKGRHFGKHKKRQMTEPDFSKAKPYKVRLDARTVITLSSMKALDFWKQRYPNLEVIQRPDAD